jgi:N-acetylglutamate synthase-like GNAT family acetyltransferase
LSENNKVLGIGALKPKSIGSKRSDGPWMSAQLVDKNHRYQGVGTALIKALEKEARQLGFKFVYCSTNTAENILQRRGWQTDGIAETLRGSVPVYRLNLIQ